MPNASELQRKQEELDAAVAKVNNTGLIKSAREEALREVRRLERELGVEAIGNINGPKPVTAQQQQDEVLVQRDEFEQDATSLQVGDAVRYRHDGLIQRLRDCVGVVTDLDFGTRSPQLAVRFLTSEGIDDVGCFQSSLIKLVPAKD